MCLNKNTLHWDTTETIAQNHTSFASNVIVCKNSLLKYAGDFESDKNFINATGGKDKLASDGNDKHETTTDVAISREDHLGNVQVSDSEAKGLESYETTCVNGSNDLNLPTDSSEKNCNIKTLTSSDKNISCQEHVAPQQLGQHQGQCAEYNKVKDIYTHVSYNDNISQDDRIIQGPVNNSGQPGLGTGGYDSINTSLNSGNHITCTRNGQDNATSLSIEADINRSNSPDNKKNSDISVGNSCGNDINNISPENNNTWKSTTNSLSNIECVGCSNNCVSLIGSEQSTHVYHSLKEFSATGGDLQCRAEPTGPVAPDNLTHYDDDENSSGQLAVHQKHGDVGQAGNSGGTHNEDNHDKNVGQSSIDARHIESDYEIRLTKQNKESILKGKCANDLKSGNVSQLIGSQPKGHYKKAQGSVEDIKAKSASTEDARKSLKDTGKLLVSQGVSQKVKDRKKKLYLNFGKKSVKSTDFNELSGVLYPGLENNSSRLVKTSQEGSEQRLRKPNKSPTSKLGLPESAGSSQEHKLRPDPQYPGYVIEGSMVHTLTTPDMAYANPHYIDDETGSLIFECDNEPDWSDSEMESLTSEHDTLRKVGLHGFF